MPLTTDFKLRDFIEPTIHESLFNDVDILKERITAKLSEILPQNEFLVAISEPDASSTTNGTIYVKMDTGQFKAIDFTIQPVPVDFNNVPDEDSRSDS